MELESGLLPTPAGSAALSVSWRARSRQEQIRDHHRAQRRGSSRRYKRRLTLLQERVSWFHSLLCSVPLRALNVVTRQGPGLSEIAFINALLRQFMARSARRYHGPYLVVAQLDEQKIIGFAPIYDCHAPNCCSGWGSDFRSVARSSKRMRGPLGRRECTLQRHASCLSRRSTISLRSRGLPQLAAALSRLISAQQERGGGRKQDQRARWSAVVPLALEKPLFLNVRRKYPLVPLLGKKCCDINERLTSF